MLVQKLNGHFLLTILSKISILDNMAKQIDLKKESKTMKIIEVSTNINQEFHEILIHDDADFFSCKLASALLEDHQRMMIEGDPVFAYYSTFSEELPKQKAFFICYEQADKELDLKDSMKDYDILYSDTIIVNKKVFHLAICIDIKNATI